jgi:hypothetical protein
MLRGNALSALKKSMAASTPACNLALPYYFLTIDADKIELHVKILKRCKLF